MKPKLVSINFNKILLFVESGSQRNLRYSTVPIIDLDECNSTLHFNGHVTNDKLCAGYAKSDEIQCYVSTNQVRQTN